MHDLYRLLTFKFYYKLKFNLLPNYFNNFVPEKSRGIQIFPIRNPQYQLPILKHEYVRNTLRCELIKNKHCKHFRNIPGNSLPLWILALYSNMFLNNYGFDRVLLDCFI